MAQDYPRSALKCGGYYFCTYVLFLGVEPALYTLESAELLLEQDAFLELVAPTAG